MCCRVTYQHIVYRRTACRIPLFLTHTLSHTPPIYTCTQRVREWVESYRDLLNGARLWHHRAKFDVGRAALHATMNNAMSLASSPGVVNVDGNKKGVGKKGGVSLVASAVSAAALQRGGGSLAETAVALQAAERGESVGSEATAAVGSGEEVGVGGPLLSVPPQLYVRCNFCQTAIHLSTLRRQVGTITGGQ